MLHQVNVTYTSSLSDPVVVKDCFPNEEAETIDEAVFCWTLNICLDCNKRAQFDFD